MRLSKNFTLNEFNFRGLPLDDDLLANAKVLSNNLQSIRDFLGKPIKVTSWYRPTTINRNVKGSKTSQHLYGEAVDFEVIGLDSDGLDDLFNLLVTNQIKLPNACSQIIRETDEKGNNWIHLAIKTNRWLDAQKDILNNPNNNSMSKSKASKRLTHCEYLVTKDTINFEMIKYIPYGDFG